MPASVAATRDVSATPPAMAVGAILWFCRHAAPLDPRSHLLTHALWTGGRALDANVGDERPMGPYLRIAGPARATSVPDRAVNRGYKQPIAHTEKWPLTWRAADGSPPGD